MMRSTKRNGADLMFMTETVGLCEDKPYQLTHPILDHYVSIPSDAPGLRVTYHLRTNISKHDLTTKRFFKTAAQTYNFIRNYGHPLADCTLNCYHK